MIPFNKPYIIGNELSYIQQSVDSGKITGDGLFTKKCHTLLENRFGFKKALLTTSCTDALEMSAILCDIKPGDEVIIPGYTFVSTANAFVLRGAKIVFADSRSDHPGVDENSIEPLITKKTKAIIPVHYAGVACDMDKINSLAVKYNLFVVEDAAQAIDSYYKGKSLGGIGNLGTFSFHETKNIISGEGGLLSVNDPQLINRAEIIREKGTNRSAFFRGEIDKYGWVDVGSSFLPSDIIAAYLYAQLECIDQIQQKRCLLSKRYRDNLQGNVKEELINLPYIPDYATDNGHMFYLLLSSLDYRTSLINYLRCNEINAVFHYLSLHKSLYYSDKHDGRELPNCDKYADTLVRMPLFYDLTFEQVDYICDKVIEWSKKQ